LVAKPVSITPSIDWTVALKAALDATSYMALATVGPAGPWNNAVYFSYDSYLNLYFISEPQSRHMQNITSSADVALAIFSTQQPSEGDVLGLQVRGRAEILAGRDVVAAHHIYYARSPAIPGISSALTDYLSTDAPWKFVKVMPTEIGLFDTEHFGGQRQTVPKGVTL
jgi:uncharacterized protein YhbP (UPF0306 family)